jgi:predicted phosphodiesterase
MRTAVLSDIHGNLTALEAVVADLKQVSPDLVVQAGDLIGGSRNAEVIDLVQERGWPGVYGNAEEMLWIPEQVTLATIFRARWRMDAGVVKQRWIFSCRSKDPT